MNQPLHPIFKHLLKQHFGITTPNINSYSTESDPSEKSAQGTTMNLNQMMGAVEAHDGVLLAQQEARNAVWEAAYEEAEEKIRLDDLLDALFKLSESEKAAALIDIANGRFPGSLAEAYDGLVSVKAQEVMQQRGEQGEPEDFGD